MIGRKTLNEDNPYEERNAFWTELAINQFGTTLNFFSLISLGFLAFVVDKNNIESLFKFSLRYPIDYKKIFIAISLIMCLLSIFCSSIAILSRLHDLRLTRHTIWTRYRFYNKKLEHLKDDHINLANSLKQLLINFYSTLAQSNYYITDIEVENREVLIPKFQALRQRNLLLGRLSYRMFGYQIAYFIISIILFFISNVL